MYIFKNLAEVYLICVFQIKASGSFHGSISVNCFSVKVILVVSGICQLKVHRTHSRCGNQYF